MPNDLLSRIPLSSLRYLEAAVRLGSFDATARMLNVTPSAVSQHIRRIEDALGQPLFHRSRNRVIPSPLAQELARVLADAFAHIGAALRLADAETDTDRVKIRLFHTWAIRWLVPRLDRFTRQFPNIPVEFENGTRAVDFSTTDATIALGLSCLQTSGIRRREVLRPTLAPVCSPELARRICGPQDLATVPLICSRNRIAEWTRWLETLGVAQSNQRPILVFASSNLAYEAALAGAGVALAHIEIVLNELETGRLVRPLPTTYPAAEPFFLYEYETRSRNRALMRFRAWLITEIETLNLRTRRYLEETGSGASLGTISGLPSRLE